MKKTQFIIPAFAFFFAIVASFASVNAKGTLLDVRVSKVAPNDCVQIAGNHCVVQGSTDCKQGSVSLREYFTATGTCGSIVSGIYEAD